MDRFIEEIRHSFCPLIDNFGFKVIEETPSKFFGPDISRMIFKCKHLLFRIEELHAELYVYVGSSFEPNSWSDLAFVLEVLTGKRYTEFIFEDTSVLASIIELNLKTLEQGLNQQNYSQTYRKAEEIGKEMHDRCIEELLKKHPQQTKS